MSKNDTSITSDKRKNMPPRGKGNKSVMLDAIRDVCNNEQEFLKQVITIGLGGWTQPDDEDADPVFQQPNPMLLNMVLNRIEPPLKSVSPMVEFDFNIDGKPHEQAMQVIDAMSNGKIPSDIGQMFVTSISSMLNIKEKTDFEERLKAIENANKQD